MALTNRKQLPDALRVLLHEFPHQAWADHPNYSQLIAFWLDRHLMFRQLTEALSSDADLALDKAIEPDGYGRRLAHLGGMLISELQGHHQIEDKHYFPTLATLDQRVRAGFELLDRDHHDLDDLLAGLSNSAHTVLRSTPTGNISFRDAVAGFRRQLKAFEPLLHRHLVDEEELVVPVLLKYAPEQFG